MFYQPNHLKGYHQYLFNAFLKFSKKDKCRNVCLPARMEQLLIIGRILVKCDMGVLFTKTCCKDPGLVKIGQK
jgi:hypothetical protein